MKYRYHAVLFSLALSAPAVAQPALLVTNNPDGLDADAITRVSTALGTPSTPFTRPSLIQSVESVAFDGANTGYVTLDLVMGKGGILIADSLGARTTDRDVRAGDRMIMGDNTGLVAPKGLIHTTLVMTAEGGANARQNFLIVADNGANNVKGFPATASGDVLPFFTLSLGARKPWDVAYDVAANRLFVAATDGTVLVYDSFGVFFGSGGPSRVITPTNAGGTKISVNLHGISLAADNRLVLSDVGLATSATDGQIFVLDNASTANGNVPVRYVNAGAASRLGNPVDTEVDGANVYVAEKSNNVVLRFDGVLSKTGTENVAPNASIAVAGAESVARTAMGGVFATSNPAGFERDLLLRLQPDLSDTTAVFARFGLVSSLQSTTVTREGMAITTFDGRVGGGLLFLVGAANQTSPRDIGIGDRFVLGANTGLRMPKGLEVVRRMDLVLVADVGTAGPGTGPDIKAFSTAAQGNVAPTFVVSNLGMTAGGVRRAVWDVSYDSQNDRLYGAGTDGVVVVYDNFSTIRGANGPNRTITPTDGTAKISVNLHGIQFISGTDNLLFLTDVGSAASATDGQVFSIAGANTANGNTAVRFRSAGANTLLGNPVDLTFDGTDLFVAEKSNDRILRYANARFLTGTANAAPVGQVTTLKPESIALTMPITVAVEGEGDVTEALSLGQNQPNPFRGATQFRYRLAETQHVRLAVYDLMGREVALLADGVQPASEHEMRFDAAGLAAGVYVYRLTTGGRTITRTMVLVK